MKETGKFFAAVVVGLGCLQLIIGTIGLLVWGREWDSDYERPNLSTAMYALVPNLLVSSLLVAFGAYIYVRLSDADSV